MERKPAFYQTDTETLNSVMCKLTQWRRANKLSSNFKIRIYGF